jgi:hypothetical protein
LRDTGEGDKIESRKGNGLIDEANLGAYTVSLREDRRRGVPPLATAILALLLLLGSAAADRAFAQDSVDTFDEALGGFAGFVGGTGISYQRWIGAFGWQVAGGGYYLPSGDGEYAVGVEAMYRIHDAEVHERVDSILYTVAGLGHYADIQAGAFQARIHGGLGIGVETVFFEHFSFPIELLYRGTLIVNDFSGGLAGLQPGAGFRFRY